MSRRFQISTDTEDGLVLWKTGKKNLIQDKHLSLCNVISVRVYLRKPTMDRCFLFIFLDHPVYASRDI